jgi:hypothetical protein
MLPARLWVPVAATLLGAASAQAAYRPPVRPVDPRAGNRSTTFSFTYDSTGQDGSGGDQLYLVGPRGTHCQGLVAQFPTGHSPGRQRILIGPRVRDPSNFNPYRYRPDDPRSDQALSHWCPGVYRGRVQFEQEGGEAFVEARFRFRVR